MKGFLLGQSYDFYWDSLIEFLWKLRGIDVDTTLIFKDLANIFLCLKHLSMPDTYKFL